MSTTISAVYENGVFRPLEPVEGVDDGTRVELAVSEPANAYEKLKKFIGMIPKEDLELIDKAVEEAFEQVDPDEWQ